MAASSARRRYWRRNILLVALLLAVWFVVSCVLSIFCVDALNRVRIGGFPLGFWFAQQGSIVAFILLILIYALAMGRLDRKLADEEDAEGTRREDAP